MSTHRLPEGFLWGAATSAQQIEGSADVDGRGRSIWDEFAATPGKIADASSPAVACDHYRLWSEDIDRMRWLGLGAYRFSIAWPRILPSGTGAVNAAGLDFYDRLVDTLLAANIRPCVTLYHWDLPQALQELGGWAARDTVCAFVEYAGVISRRLGDRVPSWVTHNEPWCTAVLGHADGHHAPGHQDPREALRVAHHVLLSHGEAVAVIRANAPAAEVGIVLNLVPGEPASTSPKDIEAVRRFDGAFNRWYLDPVFRGRYPEDVVKDLLRRGDVDAAVLPFVAEGDLATISRPLDFLGVNYYTRAVLRASADGEPVQVHVSPPERRNDMGWEDYPRGLTTLLQRLHREYQVSKLYVTENGTAIADTFDDTRRVDFLRGHLIAAHQAIAAGVPLRGYFAWSLLDNWEWAHGYPMRFGLFDVDYATQQRTAKRSAHWYREVIAANAVVDGERSAEGHSS